MKLQVTATFNNVLFYLAVNALKTKSNKLPSHVWTRKKDKRASFSNDVIAREALKSAGNPTGAQIGEAL